MAYVVDGSVISATMLESSLLWSTKVEYSSILGPSDSISRWQKKKIEKKKEGI